MTPEGGVGLAVAEVRNAGEPAQAGVAAETPRGLVMAKRRVIVGIV